MIKQFLQKFLSSILIISAAALFSTIVYYNIMGNEREKSWDAFTEAGEMISSKLSILMDNNISTLELAAATIINQSGIYSRESIIHSINRLQDTTIFSRIDLLYPDNSLLLLQSGKTLTTEHSLVFNNLAFQGQSVSKRLVDPETKRQVVHYYLPVIQNNQVTHILVGVIDCLDLAQYFYSVAYDGQTICCAVDAHSGDFITAGDYPPTVNLYDMLPERHLSGYETINLKQEVQQGNTGIAAYTYEAIQKNFYIYYTPLNFYDWQLLIIAPEDVIFSDVYQMRFLLYCLATAQTLLIAAYLAWNWHNTNRLQKSKKIINEQLSISSTLLDCIKQLSSNSDIHIALNRLLKIINQYFDGDQTYFFTIDYELRATSRLYKYIENVDFTQNKEVDNLSLFSFDNIITWLNEATHIGGHYISFEHLPTDIQKNVFPQHNVHGLIALPMLQENTIVGFLGIINPKQNQDNIDLLYSLQYFILSTLDDHKKRQQLQQLSYTDTLTGLYNQNKFIQLQEEYHNLQFKNLGIAYFDLNDLKKINDCLGHNAGDDLIKQAASNIKQLFPTSTYRVGGDEFVAIAVNIPKSTFENQLEDVCQLMRTDNINVASGMSWRSENVDFKEQMREADKRMYENKKQYHTQNKEE